MIVNFFLKFYLKRKVKAKNLTESFTFPEIFQKAGNLLVCLPGKLEEAIFSLRYLEFLPEIFSSARIYLLTPFNDLEKLIPEKSIFHFIYLPEKSKKFFSSYQRNFLKKLREYKFHIALDFDLGKNILNSYLCLVSGSLLRIGLKGGLGNPYYNVELALPQTKAKPEELYQAFIETLKKVVKG
jgi:hypothetical protein